jgi:hypothetical protein
MTLTRRKNSMPRGRASLHNWIERSNWVDSSGAWAPGEEALILPIASASYDSSREEDADASPQLIPVPPPVWDGSAKLRRSKRRAATLESSVLIPIEKTSFSLIPFKKVSSSLIPIEKVSPSRPAQKINPRFHSRRAGISVLLLLLSVIMIFVFAYLAQKHGG